MPHGEYAVCPKCNTNAFGENNIQKYFGYRTIDNKRIPQSYCRTCRKENKRFMKSLKEKEK